MKLTFLPTIILPLLALTTSATPIPPSQNSPYQASSYSSSCTTTLCTYTLTLTYTPISPPRPPISNPSPPPSEPAFSTTCTGMVNKLAYQKCSDNSVLTRQLNDILYVRHEYHDEKGGVRYTITGNATVGDGVEDFEVVQSDITAVS